MSYAPDILPYARLSRSITGADEAAAVARILSGESYLGMGEEVTLFEKEIAKFLGLAPWQILCVNSGTAALHLAVNAVCPPGSEVLLPSLTYVACAQAITAAGCVPVFCDVYEHSATIDLKDAAARMSPRTCAIMPMHYGGNAWQLHAVYDFAANYKLRIIEDAAHAFGGTYGGMPLGAQGDMVCFSFDGIKNITSCEGGCIVTFDEEAASICRECRVLGLTAEGASVRQGWRYHMSNVCAAIGRVQLRRFQHEFAPKRQMLMSQYQQELAHLREDVRFFQYDDAACVVPHICPVRIMKGTRETVRKALAHQHIASGVHYRPCHTHPFFETLSPFPVTEKLYTELLTLPLHPDLEEAHITHICTALEKALF